MPRLTITISEEKYQALKETAARRRRTIRSLIEESLDFYGIKTLRSAADLVARARRRSGLSEKEAMKLALAEVRERRRG